MPYYKLAAFDMDGTLLDSNKKILPSSIDACRRATAAGRIIALDTGRAISELLLFPLEEMGIRYGSCACGTVIYDFRSHHILAKKVIPSDFLPLIVEASRKEDVMLQAMVDGISYVSPADVKNMPHFNMEVYQPLYESTSSFADDIRAFVLAHVKQINKINLYHTSPACRERTLQRLSHLPLDYTFAETTSLEITPKGVSKGTGLQDLCKVLGVDIENAIAVGDAFNDIPMLQAAGLGVAMGNSNESAINAADVVVADNDHDGIAEVIDKFMVPGTIKFL